MQRLLCESARLARALGATEATRRTAAVYDTVVRTPADRAAARRAGAAASGRAYAISGEVCDSLRAIADREDGPIPPAPDSMMWR